MLGNTLSLQKDCFWTNVTWFIFICDIMHLKAYDCAKNISVDVQLESQLLWDIQNNGSSMKHSFWRNMNVMFQHPNVSNLLLNVLIWGWYFLWVITYPFTLGYVLLFEPSFVSSKLSESFNSECFNLRLMFSLNQYLSIYFRLWVIVWTKLKIIWIYLLCVF